MEDDQVLKVYDDFFKDVSFGFCGYAKCWAKHQFGPAVRTHYLFHYILSGQGVYQVGRNTYKLSAGQGFLIEPGVSTWYQADAVDPWTYVWVGFSGEQAPVYLADLGLGKNQLVFTHDCRADMEMLIFNMLSCDVRLKSARYRLQGYLYEFFALLCTSHSRVYQQKLPFKSPYLEEAIKYIQTHYHEAITIEKIAQAVGIDRTYLHTLFKEILETTPKQFLNQFRVSYACELLDLTSLSITEIAGQCGYQNPLVFSRLFKQMMDATPAQYRSQKRRTT